MTPETIYEIFARFKKANPNPVSELHYQDPFQLLVAVILSAQATDKKVNEVTPSLFAAASTPEAMVELGETKIANLIRHIGLYRNKAKNLYGMSKKLIENFNGKVPDTREALESLPGVGRKTANVILNIVFGVPVIAVDTHVFRVANRTGLAHSKTVEDVEKQLEQNIPEKFLDHAHHWLVLHGRYVCKAKKPDCKTCIISDLCEYPDKNFGE